jgi:hypothetical protein
MAVGFPVKENYATGDVLSAGNMNDLSGTVNTVPDLIAASSGGQYAAGKNKIINGDFGVWQRGTTFTNAAFNAYTSDRWAIYYNGTMTQTVSQQTFTPGTAPVAGYEGSFFWRWNVTAASGNTGENIFQKIEDVRTLAGQTTTISFWAKADAARTVGVYAIQNFGSGGSGAVSVNFGNASLTTAWQRFTLTAAIPSISGKTIGTGSNLEIDLYIPTNTVLTFDLWGVQVEAASTASPFQTATGTKQGELAACQRYFQKTNNQTEAPGAAPSVTPINALNASSTLVVGIPPFKVNMRTGPTVVLYSAATGASGKIRSGGSDVTATAADVGEYSIGYISATGLVSGSNSTVTFTASAEL